MSFYFLTFFASIALSFILTLIIKKLAARWNIVDAPDQDRKAHKNKIPLLGGIAIFLSLFTILYFVGDRLVAGDLNLRHWFGFFAGGLIIMIGGVLDDKYNLKPLYQFLFAVLASLAVVAGGVEIEKITNPLGGFVFFNNLKIPVIGWGGAWHYFVVISDSFIILWLLGMMYTTKLLDGLDGLVSGVTSIGALIIFLFTLTSKYYQPDIGLAALVLAGASLGFLILNWHPAKIFLGGGGSLFLGYALGVLSIISGAKIAIALLIMGIPILDVLWTIIRRTKRGKNPFRFADRGHLHFRISDTGLGTKKTVIIYYIFSALFGLSALFLQSSGKLLSLIILIATMIIIVIGFNIFDKSSSNR